MRFIGNDPKTPRQTQVVASGTLSTGDTVIVNSDGTVSAVSGSSAEQVVGSDVRFETGTIEHTYATFDSDAGRVIIVYRDTSNSNAGTAVVGTVSGTSISFGTPVVFASSAEYTVATFDNSNNKVVAAYQDDGNSSYGTAIVGTVSGTSISFGSSSVFESEISIPVAAVFDTSTNQAVISFRNGGQGYRLYAVSAAVSGTSVSFGTSVRVSSGNSSYSHMAYDSTNNAAVFSFTDDDYTGTIRGRAGTLSGTVISLGTAIEVDSISSANYNTVYFDSSVNKAVFAYRDNSNSSYGTIKLGTVSGTSLSVGAATVFNSSNTEYLESTFDSNAGKGVIAYRDGGNSNAATLRPISISGTTVTAETAVVYKTGTNFDVGITFDSTNNIVVLAYRDLAASSQGYSVPFQNAYSSTNLTAENYIGTAKSGAADGDGVVVNTKGNVDTGQTGLTAGQSYYVQTDGSLDTTEDDPSVFAGTAVSATKLIVKG